MIRSANVCTLRRAVFLLLASSTLVAADTQTLLTGNFTLDDTTSLEALTFCGNFAHSKMEQKAVEESLLELWSTKDPRLKCAVVCSAGASCKILITYIITIASSAMVQTVKGKIASTTMTSLATTINARLDGKYVFTTTAISSPDEELVQTTDANALAETSEDMTTSIIVVLVFISLGLTFTVGVATVVFWRRYAVNLKKYTRRSADVVIGRKSALNDLTFHGAPVKNLYGITFEEMVLLEEKSTSEVSKVEWLVYHFFPPEILPLIEKYGLRAAGCGQAGGGLSVSMIGPAGFGWEKYGGGDYRENIGKKLWGEKWQDVMPDGPAEEKVNAVACLKIPRQWQCTSVPGRDDIRIIPKELLLGRGKEYYLTPDRIKDVVFLFDPTKVKPDEEEFEAPITPSFTSRFVRTPQRTASPGPLTPQRTASPGPVTPQRIASPGPVTPHRDASPGSEMPERIVTIDPELPEQLATPGPGTTLRTSHLGPLTPASARDCPMTPQGPVTPARIGTSYAFMHMGSALRNGNAATIGRSTVVATPAVQGIVPVHTKGKQSMSLMGSLGIRDSTLSSE